MKNNNQEKISICICSKDRVSELSLLLQSLRNQTYKNWDLVLVEESHQDRPIDFYEFITKIKLQLLREGHKITQKTTLTKNDIGKARNQATALAETDLVVRIDDDSICEADYLERLYNIISKNDKAGAVSGIVPSLGQAPVVRNLDCVGKIFNRIDFDEQGNMTYVGDDGGCEYTPDAVLPAHHLRSSFIFRKDVHDKVGKHPTEFGKTGFREESDLTMRMRFKGYDLFTDTAAKAWHLRTQSGGVRYQDYSQQVGLCDEMWRRKMRRWFKKYGWRV